MIIHNQDNAELQKFADIASRWWERDGPVKTLHDINPVRMAFMQEHVRFAGLRVLDVGCGGGILSETLSDKAAEVFGLDANPALIDVATAHALGQKSNLHYETCLLEDYQGKDFDVICCMELLEHVPQPADLVLACSERLKPGGWLFVSTLHRSWQTYLKAIVMAEYVLGLLPRQTHDYQRCIKPSELAAMGRRAGLSLCAMQGMQYNPITGLASLSTDVSVNYLMAFQKV